MKKMNIKVSGINDKTTPQVEYIHDGSPEANNLFSELTPHMKTHEGRAQQVSIGRIVLIGGTTSDNTQVYEADY